MARILVADDDDVSRTLVCRWLASAGHEVIKACDGKQALAVCLHSPAPDVAVLGYRMPHLTGLEVARRIRIPFLMMSAEATAQARCMRLGGIAYLQKPTDPDALLGAVNNALGFCPVRKMPPPNPRRHQINTED